MSGTIKVIYEKDCKINMEHPVIKALNEKQLEEFISISPEQLEKRLLVEIYNVNISIGNGLRRYVIGGFFTKALEYDINSIESYSPFLIEQDVYDRIGLIPLHQDCPNDVTFTFDCVNYTEEDILATTSHIIASDGKRYFYENVPIVLLEPGEWLSLTDILVKQGYNYQNAKYSITSDIIWNHLDHVDIDIMFQKNIAVRRVHIDDLTPILAKHGVTWSTYGKNRILLIPDKSLEQHHDMELMSDYYDHILEIEVPIKVIQSANSRPMNFTCEFETKGNIEPMIILSRYFVDVIASWQEIKENFITASNPQDEDFIGDVIVDVLEDLTIVTFIGYTHTYSEMLLNYIFIVDPNVPFETVNVAHPDDRSFTLQLVHGDPIKLVIDAIDLCIKDLSALLSQL